MNTKNHYANHLGNFYSWMLGDWKTKETEFREFLFKKKLTAKRNEVAIDLGAGNGVQSLALSKSGYQVIAVDFNKQLLSELEKNSKDSNQSIQIVEDDILSVLQWKDKQPKFILCCGDTITHLNSKEEIQVFIKSCYESLIPGGNFLISFRDYSKPLTGDSRFIPVMSDPSKIHTCVLEYEEDKIRVTDQLYEKKEGGWVMSVSSYFKVRLLEEECLLYLKEAGFHWEWKETFQRMITILAKK